MGKRNLEAPRIARSRSTDFGFDLSIIPPVRPPDFVWGIFVLNPRENARSH